jgi:hypothetical protein
MLKRRDAIVLGLAALSAPVFGQSHYPDRPIRLVVPFPQAAHSIPSPVRGRT